MRTFREVLSGTVKKEKVCSSWDSLLRKHPKTNLRALVKNDSTVWDFRIVHSEKIK